MSAPNEPASVYEVFDDIESLGLFTTYEKAVLAISKVVANRVHYKLKHPQLSFKYEIAIHTLDKVKG